MKQILAAFSVVLAASLAACAPPAAQTALNAGLVAPVPQDPSGLVGATPQVLNAEFGQPVLRRVDGRAQVWLYHSSVCGLNLILYPDTVGTPRVSMAQPTQDSAAPGQCTASLQRAHTDAMLERQAAS